MHLASDAKVKRCEQEAEEREQRAAYDVQNGRRAYRVERSKMA
jgi:hypothetical protein